MRNRSSSSFVLVLVIENGLSRMEDEDDDEDDWAAVVAPLEIARCVGRVGKMTGLCAEVEVNSEPSEAICGSGENNETED